MKESLFILIISLILIIGAALLIVLAALTGDLDSVKVASDIPVEISSPNTLLLFAIGALAIILIKK